MTMDEALLWLTLGRELGLKRLKVGDMEAEYGPQYTEVRAGSPMALEAERALSEKIGEEHGNPTETELLFASSPLGPPNIKTEDLPF